MTLSEVMAEVEKDAVFFDESGGGLTLSGGEPLSQPPFAEAILDACRERRINTAVETCGFARQETMMRIAGKTDLVLYDLKLVNAEKHRRYTGAENDRILSNLQALVAQAARVRLVVRIPVIPGINDSEEDLRDFIAFMRRVQVRRVDLLPYHAIGREKYRRLGVPYALEDLAPPGDGNIERFQQALESAGFEVKRGG